jgi:geranylgeranyl diphosphate synthase type II
VLAGAVGTGGLVGGQFYDLHTVNGVGALRDLAATNHLKTGVLFTAGVELSCIIAGAGGPQSGHLRGFADELGQAFQLLDDLLDGQSTAAALGKDVGQDKDKFTIVNLVGLDRARERLDGHVSAMHAHLARLGERDTSLSVLVDGIFNGIAI